MATSTVKVRGRRLPTRLPALSLLTVGALLIILPLLAMVLMSFKSLTDMSAHPLSVPRHWFFSNYSTAWSQGHLGQYLVNSLFISCVAVVLLVFLSSGAAYVIARFTFRGNTSLYMLFIAGLALPVQLIAVPVFVIMRRLGLVDSLWSVVLVYVAAGMSFSVFLLVNYFRTIPVELEEAARMEGAGHFQIYAQIAMPLARPGITTVALFNFVSAWNGLFFPLILLHTQSKFPVTVGVLSFIGQYEASWNYVLPALVIVSLPTLLVFALGSRHFVRGLTAGALK